MTDRTKSSVAAIIGRTQFTYNHNYGGGIVVPFVLRRFSTAMATRLFGSTAFGLLAQAPDAESRSKAFDKLDAQEVEKIQQELLRMAMVSPALSNETDAGTDTIAYEDLGDVAPVLYAKVMQSGGDRENFSDADQASQPTNDSESQPDTEA